jgi:hypothetical protein
MLYLTFD